MPITYQLTHSLTGAQVSVSLKVASPNESKLIIYRGDRHSISQVKALLNYAYGAFGHTIGEEASPIDLDAALRSPDFADYSVEILEGANLIKTYDPQIPPGAMT